MGFGGVSKSFFLTLVRWKKKTSFSSLLLKSDVDGEEVMVITCENKQRNVVIIN